MTQYGAFDPRALMQASGKDPNQLKMDGSGTGGIYLPLGGYMSMPEAQKVYAQHQAQDAQAQRDFYNSLPQTRTQQMMAGKGDRYAMMVRPWANGKPVGPSPMVGSIGPSAVSGAYRPPPQGPNAMHGMYGAGLPAPVMASPGPSGTGRITPPGPGPYTKGR